ARVDVGAGDVLDPHTGCDRPLALLACDEETLDLFHAGRAAVRLRVAPELAAMPAYVVPPPFEHRVRGLPLLAVDLGRQPVDLGAELGQRLDGSDELTALPELEAGAGKHA